MNVTIYRDPACDEYPECDHTCATKYVLYSDYQKLQRQYLEVAQERDRLRATIASQSDATVK